MTTFTWTGGSSAFFSDAGNWNPGGGPPGSSDDTLILLAAAAVTANASATVNTLALGATDSLTISTGTFTVISGSGTGGLAGTVTVADGAVLSVGGTIQNTGTINESSTGTTTQILLNQTTNTLAGGGKVIMSAKAGNQILGAKSTFLLDNVDNTISGSGTIGAGKMVLTNAGIVDANQSAVSLTVDTGGNIITNSGTMEATVGGDLNILSPVNNIGGTIQAVGAGSVVFLEANVTGGAVLASGGGQIQTSGTSGVLDGLGLHPVINGAPIQVADGQTLTLLGSITNNSSISIDSTGSHNTFLRIGSPIVTLSGAGSITLTNANPSGLTNFIFGNAGNFQLINQGNTISGAGQLGDASLIFNNAGLVDANQTNPLVLNTSNEITTNTGTLQASNAGGLQITSTTVNNAGGTVQALVAGSHVDLIGSTIEGGLLNTAKGGVIQLVTGNATLDGITSGQLVNLGTVVVNDQRQLSLAGVIYNSGLITQQQTSTTGSTQIRLASQTVTLTGGGGSVTMSNNGNNLIYGNSSLDTLVNVNNAISGAGQLGDGQMTLVNQKFGVINANQKATLANNGQLVVNTSGQYLTNAGLMEATNTGGLVLSSTAIINTGGMILATGAGSHVDVNGSTIEGGTLNVAGGGIIQTAGAGNSAQLDGITSGQVTNTGTYLIDNGARLDLAGTINNIGTVLLNQVSTTGTTNLRIISQNVTLTGGGALTLSDANNNQVFATNATDTLTNLNNTITGAGQFGAASGMFLVNDSVINANQAPTAVMNGQLVLNTGGQLVTNNGTLEDTGSGGLVIQNTPVNNAAGTVVATGAGTHVDLSGATIEGGLLTTAGGGVIQTVSGNGTLDGITKGVINNKGTLQVNDNTTLSLVGVINNTGLINQDSLGSNTDVRVANQSVTLQGGGQWAMSTSGNNLIFANAATDTLTNVDNTIAGSGQLGAASGMFLVNQAKGVINANQATALTVNTGADVATNTGLMEATGITTVNGGLVINSAVNNAGGTIQAKGPLAHVDLAGGTIEGGLLTGSGGGVIQTVSGNGTLDGITSGPVTISSTGTVLVNDNTTLTLVGSIVNNGLIQEDAVSAVNNTTIRIAGPTVTLSGQGFLTMTDNAHNLIFGTSAQNTLVNNSNIQGAGQFGDGGMEFINNGVIQGTGTNPLVFNLGNNNGVNNGVIGAIGSGGVILSAGIYTNNGFMTARDNSSFTFQAGVINTNLAEGVLVGGVWQAVATGHGATLAITGGPVNVDAAAIVLSGAGSVFEAGTGSGGTPYQTVEQTLSSIVTSAQLQVLNNRGYVSALGLSDSGTIQLGGGSFSTAALNVNTGGTLFGFGSVAEAVTNNGLLDAKGGLLTVTGSITGTGSVQIENLSTFEVSTASTETAAYAAGAVGTLKLDSPVNMTGSIIALAVNDVIDIAGTVTSALVSPSNVLDVKFSSGPDVFYNLGYVAGLTALNTHFGLTGDGGTGTDLTLLAGAPAGVGGGGGGSAASGGGSGPSGPAGSPPTPVTWVGAIGGDFNLGTNWNPSGVPNSADAAIIGSAPGMIVNSGAAQTVDSINVSAGNTLNLNAGTFNAINGTNLGANAGTVAVNDGAVLDLGGTIANSGTFSENSAGTPTEIVFTQTTNTLSGSGQVVLSANTNNLLFASNATFVLVNQNNKISGSGNLGDGKMTLTNQGVINANQAAAALTVDTAAVTINNSGIMEATNGGDLNILSPVNNVGGVIEAIGPGSVVNLEAGWSGGSLITSGGGAINTAAGNITLDGQALHPVNNGAALQVPNGNILTLLGVITNNNSINLNSTGNNTDLRINSPIVSLLGKGFINLTNNPNNRIFSSVNGSYQLINQGNTITGAGQLGVSSLSFTNAGVVNANQTNALILNTSPNFMINTGTLESTGTGGLVIQNTAVNNAGGTVQALVAGSHVDLSSSTIWGGTLNTALGGVIDTVSSGNTLDGITYGILNNKGLVQVNDLTQLNLAGVINNTGTLFVDQVSTPGNTQLRLASQTVTLQGGGKLKMSNRFTAQNGGGNLIYGNSSLDTLLNVDNTISGAGQLGDGQMTLVNKGTINADQAPTFTTSGQLVLNTSGNLVTNTGLIEGTNSGGLQILSTAIVNTGGTLFAAGAGHVDLSGSYIEGGLLNTSGSGVIQTVSGNGSLDGITSGMLTNQGLFKVDDLTQLTLYGVINDTGTIFEDQISRTGSTQIRLGGQTVTLQGGGQLMMSNNANNLIYGNSSLYQLVNVNDTISGSGQLGDGQMTFINQATVNATQSVALVLNTSGQIVINTGTLEDTGAGGLVISSTTVNNTGGTLQAVGAGANLELSAGAYIEGGILTTSGGGVIQVNAADTGSLDGITEGAINNQGSLVVNDGASLTVYGTINNTGVINEAAFSANGNTNIIINGQVVTLTGGGQILMSDDGNNRIYANNAAFQLVNVNNTISGAGQIGVGQNIFLINQTKGIIDATGSSALVIGTGSNVITNNGLMESTNAVPFNGGLVISSTTVNNSGTLVGEVRVPGEILASGALAHVDLSGAYIEGGLLTTASGGVIQTVAGTNTLDGITQGQLTNSGVINVNDDTSLSLVGTINDTGTINQSAFSANANTDIRLAGTTTLTGFGQLLMSDNPNNRIYGNSTLFTLINYDTIKGAGQFGTGGMQYVNNGQIQQAGNNALVINLGSGTGVNGATGVIGAIGAGGIQLTSGIFTNNGTMTANDGTSVTFQSGATNTNLAEGDLVGGTWRAIATGHGATLSMTGGTVNNDAAILVLSGAGSVIQAGTGAGVTPYTPIEQTLTAVTSGGQLQLLNNRGYVTTQNVNDNGLIQLGGGTLQANSLNIGVGGQLVGFGTVQDAVTNAGTIEAQGSGNTLTITGAVTGGTLQADSGATLALNGTGSSAATVVNNGTVALGASVSMDVTGSIDPSSAGLFVLNSAASLEVAVDQGTSNTMSFIGSGSELLVDTAAKFGNNVGLGTYTGPQLLNFGIGDSVDLKDLTFVASGGGATTDSYTSGTGLLQLATGASKATLFFQNSSLGSGSFAIANDGSGHVLVTHA